MVSGKGFEPIFTDSKSAVLPVRRSRKKVKSKKVKVKVEEKETLEVINKL